MRRLALLALLAAWMALPGCVTNYNGAAVLRAASTYQARATIEADECEAMATTAAALRAGPDPAFRVVGRAGELEAVAHGFDRHAVLCREVVARPELDAVQRARARAAFTASWQRAAEVVR